jgi:hypothetical protein
MDGTEIALLAALGIIVVGALINKGKIKNFILKWKKFEVGINASETQTPQTLSPQPASSSTQIVHVGLNEKDIKNELEKHAINLESRIEEKNQRLVEELQKSLSPADPVDHKLVTEINTLKRELVDTQVKLTDTQKAWADREATFAEAKKTF